MTAAICAHGRQLTICAVCAPAADEAYRRMTDQTTRETPQAAFCYYCVQGYPVAALEAVTDDELAAAELSRRDAAEIALYRLLTPDSPRQAGEEITDGN